MQLRVHGLGLLQDVDVGIGVFPEGEEVFVGCLLFGRNRLSLRRLYRVGDGRVHRLGHRLATNSGLFTFEQFSALAVPYHACQPTLPALEEVMEYFAELMQRLLEIQSGGRQRSPELIAEDKRLMDGLQKRNLAGKPPQPGKT